MLSSRWRFRPKGSGGPTSHARGSVASSASWSVIGYGASQVLRFGANLLLARWLFPEAFGGVALANGVLLGLEMLSDVGIQARVVQHERGAEDRFLDTGWTLQVTRGAVLALAAAVLGPLIAGAYGEPALSVLLPLAGLSVLLGGFDSMATHGFTPPPSPWSRFAGPGISYCPPWK